MCLRGSEMYGANVAISSEAGRRFATIAWLCFLFGSIQLFFPVMDVRRPLRLGFSDETEGAGG